MTTAQQAEHDDNLRLRRSEQAVAAYREQENNARCALAEATASTKRAKEKHDALFAECEKRACARRNSGQIETSSPY